MPLKMFENKWAWNFIVNIPKGWNDKNSVKINFKKLNIHTNKTCLEINPFKFAISQTGCMLGMENLRGDGT